MTKTRNVVPTRVDGETRILHPDDVTYVSRSKTEKRGRVLEPVIFTRTSEKSWELYVCVYREGEFRRIAMPLAQAKAFLTDELNRVMSAEVAARTARMEEEKPR